jgi:tetratricopeptide (TPR) repeat protein
VAQVCWRLDGIPLALEFAAARVRSLSTEQIAERLDDRFRLLSGGSRTALPRQQTLRAAVDWSYDLLSEAERRLFARLCVFAGGWTLAGAEAVVAGAGIDLTDVLDLLTQLVDKSLVLAEVRGEEVTYRLLKTVREYGQERLTGSGERDVIEQQHADYFLSRSREAAPYLSGGPQLAAWLERLERERGDVREVLQRLLARGEGERAEDFCEALFSFWWLQGSLAEGREVLEALLRPSGGVGRTLGRAKALIGAGILTRLQGDLAASQELLEDGLAIARELSDRRWIGACLSNLAENALYRAGFESARTLLEESLVIAREQGERTQEAWRLLNLAEALAGQADYTAARLLQSESVALLRESGNTLYLALALTRQGHLTVTQGEVTAARAQCTEALDLGRTLGAKRPIAAACVELGFVCVQDRDYAAARSLAEEGLALYRELGDRAALASCMELFGCLAAGQNQPNRAVQLIGAAGGLRQLIGRPLRATEQGHLTPWLEAIQQSSGDEVLAAFAAEGRAMTLERAVAYALEEPGAPLMGSASLAVDE